VSKNKSDQDTEPHEPDSSMQHLMPGQSIGSCPFFRVTRKSVVFTLDNKEDSKMLIEHHEYVLPDVPGNGGGQDRQTR